MSRPEWLPDGTWRDPDCIEYCIECGGEGAPCCDPPNHPPPGARAWLRWHLVGPLRCLPETCGQWLRPYDFVTDARRWRWQRPAQCGSAWWASLTDEQRAELADAIRGQIERGQVADIECDRCVPNDYGERIAVHTFAQLPCEHTQPPGPAPA